MPDPVAFDDLAAITTLIDTDDFLVNEDQGDGTFITKRITKANLETAIGGGDTLPVADTTAIVKGSADATKLVRIEADGLTTGTTRVLTVPDADITLAGVNLAQTFSATQTFTLSPVFTDASGTRTALGLGTAAQANTGTTGAVLPFANGTNFWSGTNQFTSIVAIGDGASFPGGGQTDYLVFANSAVPPNDSGPNCVTLWAADFAAGDARLWVLGESGSTPISIGNGAIGGLSSPTLSDQAATKGYVDAAVTGLLDFKGSTDASTNPNYPAASKGDVYVVSVAGKVGGASGKSVDAGDVYIASADNAGGDEAAVGTSWFVIEHNLPTLGTAAFVNTGTSGATIPLLSTANTWTLAQTFTGGILGPTNRVMLGAAQIYLDYATTNELRITDSGGTNNGRVRCGIGYFGGSGTNNSNVVVNPNNGGLEVTSTWYVSWTSGTAESTGPDTGLSRAAAGVVQSKVGANSYWIQNTAGRSRVANNVTNVTITPANITGLSATLIAGRKYTGELVLYCSEATAADGLRLDFDGGTATMTSFLAQGTLSDDTNTRPVARVTALATDITETTITGSTVVTIKFSLVVNAAGTFIPRFAKEADAAGATLTVTAGSYMIMEDIP